MFCIHALHVETFTFVVSQCSARGIIHIRGVPMFVDLMDTPQHKSLFDYFNKLNTSRPKYKDESFDGIEL